MAHIFLSIAFASKEELGWDLSIRPFFGADKRRQYYIDIGENTYETMAVISDVEADILNGSATRLWKVRILGSTSGPYLYLKDMWAEEDRMLEKVIHGMILNDIESNFGTDIREETASFMLTPEDDCVVQSNGKDDTTHIIMRQYSPCFKNAYHIKPIHKLDIAKKSAGIPSAADTDIYDVQNCFKIKALEYRKHYRVAYGPYAQPIHSLRKLSDVFVVLRDSATGPYVLAFRGVAN